MLHLPAQTRWRATPHPAATPTPVSLRLGQARFSVSPGDRFIAAPLLRSPQRGRLNERLSPEYGNFLRCVRCLCQLPLPACPFSGGLGGRSRIEFIVSPLPRRRHNESHFAAQSPERTFLAKPFFARAKNGVNSGRRSHEISVGKTKPDSEPSPPRGRWRRMPPDEV